LRSGGRSSRRVAPNGELVDDRELIEAAQGGDRSAFEELVRVTYRDTFTLAHRLTGNEEDASDVAQDAYLRAWKGIGKFRGEAQFSTWLYRITANTAATHLRRRRRQRAELLDERFDPAETHPDSSPAAVAEGRELLGRLSAAVDALPIKLRQVVVLRDVYALSHEAIAAELGISEAAAKVRLHRARHKLRDAIESRDEGTGATAHAV
jgi:RNA polymerase sigma-70 factor (ECF subfamily)